MKRHAVLFLLTLALLPGLTSQVSAAISYNSGSLGAAGNGTDTDGVIPNQPGAVTTGNDYASQYSGGQRTTIPYQAALNPPSDRPFTIEYWVKPSAITDDAVGPCPLFNRVSSGNRSGWVFFQRSPTTGWNFRMFDGNGSNVGWDLTGGSYQQDVWCHIVVVWTGSSGQMYVNGVLADDTNASGRSGIYNASTSATFAIGSYDDGANAFNGLVDEVAFYGTALTAEQILAHYNATSGSTFGAYRAQVLGAGAVLYLQQNGSAGAAFIPPTIPDCGLWLDGSDVDADGLADTYFGGDPINSWKDKSGLGNNFANSGAATPVFGAGLVNGLNGLTFNNSYLEKIGGVMAEGDDDYEYVVVWRPQVTGGLQRVFEQSALGNASRNAALLAIDGRYGFNGQNNDRHDLVPFAANEWILTDLKVNNALNPGNINIKHNGVEYVGTTGNPGTLNIGAVNCQIGRKWDNGEYLNGDIAELIIYKRALSDEERLQIGYYLQQKYGFSFGYVDPQLPHFPQQPVNQFGFIGDTATFTAVAAGPGPMAFQWLKNGDAIDGQTATTLVLNNVQLADAASYALAASNSFGVNTSAVVTLTVYHPVENNLVGHWKLDDLSGLVTTNATGNDLTGTLVEFPGDDSQWTFGLIEGALAFSGTRRVVINDSPLLHPDSFSVAFWIQANALGFDGTPISKESATHCETWGLELRGSGQLNFFLFNNAGFIADVQSSANLELGGFPRHVVLSYNHLTSTPDIYLDGALVSSTRGRGTASGAPGYDNSPLTFGRRLGECTYAQSFDGLLDDVQLYNKNLNSSEIAFLFNNPGEVLNPNVDLPPAITAQPLSQTALLGSNVTLTVTAAGTTPLRYQWFKDDAPLAGATSAELPLTAVQTTDAGAYFVIVTNFLGSVTSSVAQLRIVEPGSGAVAKWTFDDGTARDVIGAMNGTLMGGATIVDGRLILNGSDAFVQTEPLGKDVSEKTFTAWVALSTLDQGGGGVITLEQGAAGAQFDSIVYAEQEARRWMAGSDFWRRTASAGGPAETAGPGALVQIAIVYRSDNSIALYRNGQPYGSAYTQGTLQTYNAGAGRVLLGRRHTGATLFRGEIDDATLYDRALTPPEIAGIYAERNFRWVEQPQSVMAFAGEARSLSAVAVSDAAITYQWFKNSAPVPGATDPTLAWASLQASYAGAYYAVASSAGASITSKVARVAVRLPEDGALLARWTFEDGTARDVYGLMDGTLQGGATITEGRLQLNGTDAYLRSLPLPVNVSEKTLVAWVALSTLDQGGGGVITLQTGDGNVFDSIVFAEQEARKWMAGSDGWNRTQGAGGPEETVLPGEIVLMAIVYGADNSITLYRNGQPYGSPYTKNTLRTYTAGDGQVLLGLRHAFPAGNRMFAGQVDEARLYDRALTAAEISALAGPKLTITRAGDVLTISWPVEFTGYVLEWSPVLPADFWDAVPGVENNSVTFSLSGESQYFRLRK